jgi:hypothetical protein
MERSGLEQRQSYDMKGNRTLSIVAYGCTVQVAVADEEMLCLADRYLLPTLPRVQQPTGTANGAIRVDTVEAGFVLVTEGRTPQFAKSAMEMMPLLIRAVDDIFIGHLRGYCAVHAGSVVWKGRAILIPGMSHAGKSSLVAALLREGATYFSDEYALIDADGRVYPYPRPLLLRDGSAVQKPVLASDLDAKVGRETVPVGWIFAVKYESGAAWKVEALEQSEAVLTLLQNTPQILAETPEMLSHFGRAVQGSKCYRGERGSAENAAAEILQMASD